jgi:sec-independent protein translocase protein TatB
MFDIGWPEMLVIAIVLIVVVGPKDLPKMLRTFGKTTSKMRSMAGDFRKQFDEALKEAELDDLKTLAQDARKLNPASEIKKALSPMEKAAQDVRAGLDAAMKPTPKPTPPAADAPAVATEPAKAGPTAMPGEATPAVKPPANGAAAATAVHPKPAATAPKTTAKRPAPKPQPKPAATPKAASAASTAKPKATSKPKAAAKPGGNGAAS